MSAICPIKSGSGQLIVLLILACSGVKSRKVQIAQRERCPQPSALAKTRMRTLGQNKQRPDEQSHGREEPSPSQRIGQVVLNRGGIREEPLFNTGRRTTRRPGTQTVLQLIQFFHNLGLS